MKKCPVCGGNSFTCNRVLSEKLISDWGLHQYEVDYIDRQQGYGCDACFSNVRSMALAQTIMDVYSSNCVFTEFIDLDVANSLSILEINEAGSLTKYLKSLRNYDFICYPEYNIMELDIEEHKYDLVIHSDTLEHVLDPVKALSECKRVLKPDGRCIFTVPMIVDRMTHDRSELNPSYHGNPNVVEDDMLVYNEFGCDIWKCGIMAGFKKCTLHSFEYPTSVVIEFKSI